MASLFAQTVTHSSSRSAMLLQAGVMAMELLLLSAGLVSVAVMVRGALASSSSLLGFWDSIKCFTSSSLCICIIINSIVALIVASSTFIRDSFEPSLDGHGGLLSLPSNQSWSKVCVSEENCSERADPSVPFLEDKVESEEEVSVSGGTNEEEDHGAVGTMDSAWEAIKGGGEKARPSRKQLRKSETWDVCSSVAPSRAAAAAALGDSGVQSSRGLRKSETFKDGASRGGLRRDPSVGVEELNKQVEAFIKKFNNDMRLQRQESDQRFLDMINRGL